MWVLVALAAVGFVLVIVAAVLWGRGARTIGGEEAAANPYDDEFDRKSVTAVLDWYVLGHLEDQVRVPVEQRFLAADRENNDFLNRYYRHLLAKEGVRIKPMPSTLERSRRDHQDEKYTPRYFPDERHDENLVTFKHERIARRLVRTVEHLQRLKEEVAEPLANAESLKPGYWPFIPDGYRAFYNNLIGTGQDLDQEPGIREHMRKLAAHLVFPRFKEHVEFWADKGLPLQQVPEIIGRDALQGWFYLEAPFRPMPAPDFLLKGKT